MIDHLIDADPAVRVESTAERKCLAKCSKMSALVSDCPVHVSFRNCEWSTSPELRRELPAQQAASPDHQGLMKALFASLQATELWKSSLQKPLAGYSQRFRPTGITRLALELLVCYLAQGLRYTTL